MMDLQKGNLFLTMLAKIKIFNGKKITIRPLLKKDLKLPEKFRKFINSLITENAQVAFNKKLSLKEERIFLKNTLSQIKKRFGVFIVAEHNKIVVGTASITLKGNRQNHVGEYGITVRKDYRGIGLGGYLTEEIIKLSQKQLKPTPKIIRLSVFSTNKPAINLYKKHGFKKVAEIPNQMEYNGKLVGETIMLLRL